jgi:quinol monooxygenase YgiN
MRPRSAGEKESWMSGDVEMAVLTAAFNARPDREGDLAAVLARYVVLTRGEPACRNVDLLASATQSGRFLVIEKWDSADAARAHLDTPLMIEMAAAAVPLLAEKPTIDLLDAISAQDLE